MYKVEWLNPQGDWILNSWHKNKENAEANAQVRAKSGYTSRIIHEGKIIIYYEREAK
jgi:hypothetical protein